MYYYDKKISNITTERTACPICGNTNKRPEWEEHVSVEDDNNRLISAKIDSTFYYCKKCGYFIREGDSDYPDFYESQVICGISLMKNPIMSIRQIFTLKKHSDKLSDLSFTDHKEFVPKL